MARVREKESCTPSHCALAGTSILPCLRAWALSTLGATLVRAASGVGFGCDAASRSRLARAAGAAWRLAWAAQAARPTPAGDERVHNV